MAQLRATQRGFTLIEMLVVIGIIAVLAAIILPVYATAQEKGRQANCLSNLHAIAVATKMYRMEEKGYPGGPKGLLALYPDYLQSPKVFACPDDENADKQLVAMGEYSSYVGQGGSYNYFGMGWDTQTDGPIYLGTTNGSYNQAAVQLWRQNNIPPARYPACLNPAAPDNTIIAVCTQHAAYANGSKRVYLVVRVGGNADAKKLSEIEAVWGANAAAWWTVQPDD